MNFRKYLDIINESKMVSDIMSKLDSKVSELESNGEPVLFVYKRSKGGIRFFPKKGVDGKARPKLDQLENPEYLNNIMDIMERIGWPLNRPPIPKYKDGSKSNRFNTYYSDKDNEMKIPFVISTGSSEGHKHEDTIYGGLKHIIGDESNDELHGLKNRILSLLNKLNISPDDIHDIKHDAGKSAKRPFDSEPKDVGEIIADITIIKKDEERVFVSLKNPEGKTFGNFGIADAFELIDDKVVCIPHLVDDFFNAVGIDKQKIADGINEYIEGHIPNNDKTFSVPNFRDAMRKLEKIQINDGQKVLDYLLASYGYGYWYAREHREGWEVLDLNTLDSLKNYVGEVLPTVEVKYPTIAAKQTDINILTSTGKKYHYAIRNKSGGIIPTELVVSIVTHGFVI